MRQLQLKIKKSLDDEWYWVFYNLSDNFIVCRSCNYVSVTDNYSRKDTAIKSAKRFYRNYLSNYLEIRCVELVDENNKKISLW